MENWYLGHSKGLSDCNEPVEMIEESIIITPNEMRQYPNTKGIYEAFHNYTGIPYENFILTNGCEDALKCALSATNIKSITLLTPGWNKVEKMCDALGIKYSSKPFILNDDVITIPDNKVNDNTFTYKSQTNYFTCGDKLIGNGIDIIDYTYIPIWEGMDSIKNDILNDKNIVIGSFSKQFGAGFRLGYCCYNEVWSDKFHLQKPHNINVLACHLSKYLNDKKTLSEMIEQWRLKTSYFRGITTNELLLNNFKVISSTNNYITFYGKEITIPNEHNIKPINVSGKILYIMGIPHTEEELENVVEFITQI